MPLYLGFRIDHWDDLGMGLHQLYRGQNYDAARNILKFRVGQHQVIMGGGRSPTLAEADILTAPDGVYLPESMPMAQIMHAQLRAMLDTLLVRDHPAAHSQDTF